MKTVAAIAILISLCGQVSADSVRKIIEKKSIEIAAYLQANPEADDRAEGISHLAAVYLFLEEPAKAIPILQEKYKLLLKKHKLRKTHTKEDDVKLLNVLLVETASPMIQAMLNTRNRSGAKVFIKEVMTDWSSHQINPHLSHTLARISKQLSVPVKGEPLEIAFTDYSVHVVVAARRNPALERHVSDGRTASLSSDICCVRPAIRHAHIFPTNQLNPIKT